MSRTGVRSILRGAGFGFVFMQTPEGANVDALGYIDQIVLYRIGDVAKCDNAIPAWIAGNYRACGAGASGPQPAFSRLDPMKSGPQDAILPHKKMCLPQKRRP